MSRIDDSITPRFGSSADNGGESINPMRERELRVQQQERGSRLAAYTRFLRKTETKSLAQRKNLWLLLVSREGLEIAEDAGAKLNVDHAILAAWIEEWLQDENRPPVTI